MNKEAYMGKYYFAIHKDENGNDTFSWLDKKEHAKGLLEVSKIAYVNILEILKSHMVDVTQSDSINQIPAQLENESTDSNKRYLLTYSDECADTFSWFDTYRELQVFIESNKNIEIFEILFVEIIEMLDSDALTGSGVLN